MAEYKAECNKFSYVGGGDRGVLSSCKESHAEYPNLCPDNCPYYEGKKASHSSKDEHILDFGAGAARWYRVD